MFDGGAGGACFDLASYKGNVEHVIDKFRCNVGLEIDNFSEPLIVEKFAILRNERTASEDWCVLRKVRHSDHNVAFTKQIFVRKSACIELLFVALQL